MTEVLAQDADRLEQLLAGGAIRFVRVAWCDLHGLLRSKTLTVAAARRALRDGLGIVSTVLLKDGADRTAFPVFERQGAIDEPRFAFGGNLLLRPDPSTATTLPWAPDVAWVQGELFSAGGEPVDLDPRRVLRRAIARLAQRGLALRCGLEVEFHVYRIVGDHAMSDPHQADWPGMPPDLALVHPGYALLSDACADRVDEVFRIVADTAAGLGLPLASLEVEFGPSQVEAVFEVCDALRAADDMVRFRNGVRQALLRHGYWATFMCRPPFPNVMASGWHLHQSVSDLRTGENRFVPSDDGTHRAHRDALCRLSPLGAGWLAGLLEHARAGCALATTTTNGYGRFRPNALAPQSVLWGYDNRGAMLRVIGGPRDAATRIENRAGEPAANPYLYLAAQIHAGLDGVERSLPAPPATDAPYDAHASRLPASLDEALDALCADEAMVQGFGIDVVRWYERIKRADAASARVAPDAVAFDRRQFLARI